MGAEELEELEKGKGGEEVLVDEDGAFVSYRSAVLTAEEAADIFSALATEIPWRRETDDFGLQERLTAYMGDEGCVFTYVGLRNDPLPWHPKVSLMKCAPPFACHQPC
mmetsp:Transcript_21094/g.58528  ORF Transcript_21094/g.58528 Transcript_21094/m.58528 type:complete len:108 (-) Transcript_21094:20-343(-)